MWWGLALLSALFAALTTIFAKIGLSEVSPTLATAIRTAIIVPLAWGLVFVTGDATSVRSVTSRGWLFLTLSAIATGASWLCYFQALQIGTASAVAAIDKTSLVLVLLLGVIFLQEPLDLRTGLGIALIVSGTLVLIR
ncbi:MAG: EamA family transporter [Nitrospiraceae bacterium]